jgi:hypothetical protein
LEANRLKPGLIPVYRELVFVLQPGESVEVCLDDARQQVQTMSISDLKKYTDVLVKAAACRRIPSTTGDGGYTYRGEDITIEKFVKQFIKESTRSKWLDNGLMLMCSAGCLFDTSLPPPLPSAPPTALLRHINEMRARIMGGFTNAKEISRNNADSQQLVELQLARDVCLESVVKYADDNVPDLDSSSIPYVALNRYIYSSLALSELGNAASGMSQERDECLARERAGPLREPDWDISPYADDAETDVGKYLSAAFAATGVGEGAAESVAPRAIVFDHVYFLTCARMLRKKGSLDEARLLLDAFTKFPNSVGKYKGEMYDPIVSFELHINRVAAPTPPPAHVKAKKQNVNAHSGSAAPAFVPVPSFTCAMDEWAYVKSQLPPPKKKQLVAMDRIMENFVGLEEVKVEMLNLYLRYEDSIAIGTWTGELPNFQFLGNPGSGNS